MREDIKDIEIISVYHPKGPISNQLDIRWYDQSGQR